MPNEAPTSIPRTSLGSRISKRMLCWVADSDDSPPISGSQSNRALSTPPTGSPAAPLVALSTPTATSDAIPAATAANDIP